MASFEEILNRPSTEIKQPPAYPTGTYHCLVDGPPAAEESSQKKTPCRTYRYKIIAPMAGVDMAAYTEQQLQGKSIAGQMTGTAFYITEEAAFRYKEFLIDHLGIPEMNGSGQAKTLKELEAEAPGKQLLVKLRHELSTDGKRVYHKVDSTAHV